MTEYDATQDARRLSDLMEQMAKHGRTARQLDMAYPDDEKLWSMAHRIDPDMFGTWAAVQVAIGQDPGLSVGQIADQLDELREAYDRGRLPDLIDLNKVAATLRAMGIPASTSHDSGGTWVLHVGRDFKDADGEYRSAVTAGGDAGVQHGTVVCDRYDFSYGTGDTTVPDDQRISETLPEDRPYRVAEVAKLIAAVLDEEMDRRGFDAKTWEAHTKNLAERIEAAVSAAQFAFWEKIAGHFPEITTGDMDPGMVVYIDRVMGQAVESWIDNNEESDTPWAAKPAELGGRELRVTPLARYAAELRKDDELVSGWAPDIWALRQRVGLVVAVPINGDPDAEIYASSYDDAVQILNDWQTADLRDAARRRRLPVPVGKRNKAGYIEALIAAGPAHFNEGGDRF